MYNTKILHPPVVQPALWASLVPLVVAVEAYVVGTLSAVHVRRCQTYVTVLALWIQSLLSCMWHRAVPL